MNSFNYYSPTKIVFGKDGHKRVGELVKECCASRVLIVYGSERIVKSGLLGEVTAKLDEANIAFDKIGGVVANPHLSLAREGVKKAIEFKADMILAVGGGSVIDTAKAVAAGTANPDTDIWEFWSGKKKFDKDLLIGVILTISAAGSETSNSAVITNDETWEKRGVNNNLQRPKFAIMNPELTYSLPKKQVIAGVVDIIMHTFERYFTPVQGNHMSDEMAEGLIRNMIKYGPVGIEDSHNYEAMSEIMWCGSVSHIDLTGLGSLPEGAARSGDWATHQLGHELSGMFDSTHGESLAVMWPVWAKYVVDADYKRFAQYGRKVWNLDIEDDKDCALKAIDKTAEFFKSIGAPTNFSELGIGVLSEEKLIELADNCAFHKTRTIGAMKNLAYEDILEIYKGANK